MELTRSARNRRVILVTVALIIAFSTSLEGLWRLATWRDADDAVWDYFFIQAPCLIIGFMVISGWTLIRFRLIVDRSSAIVASIAALFSLYFCIFWINYPGYQFFARERFLTDVIDTSGYVVPLWILYLCAVGFARYYVNRAKPVPPD